MELNPKEKTAFLRGIGDRVEKLIYQKYKSKDQFIRETGFHKRPLHDVLMGNRDTHVSMILKLAKALDVKPKDLIP